MTTAEQDRAAFLAERKQGLGGSDIGAILGLSPYRSPLDVWLDKTNQAPEQESKLQLRFGTYAEQFVADEYEAHTGRKVQKFNAMLKHPSAPVLGHIDRLVVPHGAIRASHRQEVRTDKLLECKTASPFALNSAEWGESGTDLIPAPYLIQCATYMALTGCDSADLACLFGNQEFRVYTLRRDLELEADLLEQATAWWQRHIIEGVMPDPRSADEARRMWPKHINGKRVVVDVSIADAIRQRFEIKSQINALEKKLEPLENLIFPVITDAEEVVCNGGTIATYRANKSSQRTDWQGVARSIQQDIPADLIAKYTSEKAGARVLRIINSKGE